MLTRGQEMPAKAAEGVSTDRRESTMLEKLNFTRKLGSHWGGQACFGRQRTGNVRCSRSVPL